MKLFGAGAVAPFLQHEMENAMDKPTRWDDLNYQEYGNKMVTKRDHERYKASVKLISFRSAEAYSPDGAAEKIHRPEGKGTGEIGAFEQIKDNNNNIVNRPAAGPVDALLMNKLLSPLSLLREITPLEKLENANVPADPNRIFKSPETFYIPFTTLVLGS